MSTPKPENWDAALNGFPGPFIRDYIRNKYKSTEWLADIGAGWGKYKLLLPEFRMSAVEIWEPYILSNGLRKLYEEVFHCDVRDWQPRRKYAAAIFGDSFEHLSSGDARAVLDKLKPFVGEFILSLPHQMKQEEVDGNPYEKHVQDDLNKEVMAERFPEMKFLAQENVNAVYVSNDATL